MVIQAKTAEKFNVAIAVRNSRDNAYNTKVTVSFTQNINYVKVEVRVDEVFVHTCIISVSAATIMCNVCIFVCCLDSLNSGIVLSTTPKWSVPLDIRS